MLAALAHSERIHQQLAPPGRRALLSLRGLAPRLARPESGRQQLAAACTA